ncbi:hypothetical protein ACOMHN_053277 [Nucella lapillus]
MLENIFKEHCKQYVYQLERGTKSGYEHYQCRFTLNNEKRPGECLKLIKYELNTDKLHLTVTSKDVFKKNFYYCMAEVTRIDGPWKTKNPMYIPYWKKCHVKTMTRDHSGRNQQLQTRRKSH